MSRVDWPELLRFGLGELGLDPGRFWALTPVELLLLAGLVPGSTPSLTRRELETLRAQFPDLNER